MENSKKSARYQNVPCRYIADSDYNVEKNIRLGIESLIL